MQDGSWESMRDRKDEIPEVEVASPCVGKCKMGLDSYCGGCRRTIGEIMDWPYLNDAEKTEVLRRVGERK